MSEYLGTRHGETGTGGRGDGATRGRGDAETRRHMPSRLLRVPASPRPCVCLVAILRVPPSPRPRVSLCPRPRVCLLAAALFALNISAANIEPPPDPGFDVSAIAADTVLEVEILAGGPFRAVALVKKALRGDAPKIIELEGFNSFNWDTVHHGLATDTRWILFLSKTERPDVFVPLTPAAPRFAITAEGATLTFGVPALHIPVKIAALEQALKFLFEKNMSGKVPQGAESFLRGLWEQEEIDPRYLAVVLAGMLRDERALPLLVEGSKDKVLKMRLHTVEALGKIGTPEALDVLRRLLRDDRKTVAREAARALTLLRDADSIPAVLEWVRKNGAATDDTDPSKTESVAVDAINFAKAAGTFSDPPKISRLLLEIARLPNDRLVVAAINACTAVAPVESVPGLIELAQDRLFDYRDRAFSALNRLALKPVRDADEFQAWWKDASAKFTEDTRRDAAEAAARGLARAEEFLDRQKFLETLRNMPGGIGVVSASPFLLNAKTSAFFGEDDLVAWNTPLVVPFLIERLGRDNSSDRRSALEALVTVCSRNPRLRAALWPLIGAHLAEKDSGIRRTAQTAVGTLSRSEGINALLDATAARGIYEAPDCVKYMYTVTARTFGLSFHEPVPDQIVARDHFRGWWEGAQSKFRELSVSTPVNPFAIFPGDSAKLRVYGTLDAAARTAKLEALALSDDSDPSGAAFNVLLAERGADDAFWKKMIAERRLRDRARGILGALGSAALASEFQKRLESKADAEPPMTRALALLSLAAAPDGTGGKAISAWLKSTELAANHPMKRLAVVSLGLSNNEPQSLAYLTDIVNSALKTEPADPDLPVADETANSYSLLRSALVALCARQDSSAALVKALTDSSDSKIRETAARALSLRRERAAIPGIVKALDRGDRYSWLDLAHLLEPLLTADDGAVLVEMMESYKSSTRAAAVWILSRRLELGNDAATRARLIAALGDDSNLVRYYAAESLGKRKAKAALDGLVKLLDDIDDDVKAVAAEALGELGDKDACELAVKAALNLFRDPDSRWMKALAVSGNPRFVAAIMKLANSNKYGEQRAGLEALAAADTDEARASLLKTFRSDDAPLQTFAADLLAQRPTVAMALIKDDLVSKEKGARARAYHLLARIQTPAARTELENALKAEQDEKLKLLVEWALGRSQSK